MIKFSYQGFTEDSQNVAIIMEVFIDESKEEFTDFFWLIQRSIKLYEGEEGNFKLKINCENKVSQS